MLLGNPRCIARTIIFSAILIAGIIRISEASPLLGTQFNGLFTIDDNTAEAGLIGNVQLGPDTLDLSTLASDTANIPEPSTLALFATGLAGLGFMGWRRRKATRLKAA